MNKEHVTSNDLSTYKKILLMTNAHFEGYLPGVINVTGGKISAKSSPPLANPKAGSVESGLRRAWKKY